MDLLAGQQLHQGKGPEARHQFMTVTYFLRFIDFINCMLALRALVSSLSV